MHGLGDSSEGFLDFFYAKNPVVPNKNTKVILLNAPNQRVTVNGGESMNSWYDILAFGSEPRISETQVAKSTKRVLTVIQQEAALLNEDYTKIYIGGFSQGCCMSINVAVNSPKRLGGVIGLSGAVFQHLQAMIDEDKDSNTFEDVKKNLSFFLYHGKADGVIQYGVAAKSYEKFKQSGFEKVQFYGEEYLAHSVSDTEIKHLKEFFNTHMV